MIDAWNPATSAAALKLPHHRCCNQHMGTIVHLDVTPKVETDGAYSGGFPLRLLHCSFGEDPPLRVLAAATDPSGSTTYCDEKRCSVDIAGWYVSGLQIVSTAAGGDIEIEIGNIRTESQLNHLLHRYSRVFLGGGSNSSKRRKILLALSKCPPPVFSPSDGLVYTLSNLPPGDLGVSVEGFNPPRIVGVDPSSILAPLNVLRAGHQAVHAVVDPSNDDGGGRTAFDAASPGFTGARIERILRRECGGIGGGGGGGNSSSSSSSKTGRRILIVKDVLHDDAGATKPRSGRREVVEPGERCPFDWGGFDPRRIFWKFAH